ncbi:unnamed protein product [Larinioides sclopetarius]|uniref:LAGLIDADG homing endonuclease n=2 Tax=Larinioides sclopetarius TaxID=280406 RepID=A0AAV2A6F9_9ARAC
MENICIKILQILPKLEPNTLDSLMKRLEDIGVAAENDLKLFTNDFNARGQWRQSTNISILVKRVKLFSHQLIVQ